MKPLTISNAPQVIMELQEEIWRSRDARCDHRLHAVLLVAQDMPCSEVAHLLGDGKRTVQMWVRQFENEGLSELQDKPRSGMPPCTSNRDRFQNSEGNLQGMTSIAHLNFSNRECQMLERAETTLRGDIVRIIHKLFNF